MGSTGTAAASVGSDGAVASAGPNRRIGVQIKLAGCIGEHHGSLIATLAHVIAAAGDLEFDDGNCPTVDSETSATLVNLLQTDADGEAATDDLAGTNVLAIVVQINKDLVDDGGALLATWATTNMAP